MKKTSEFKSDISKTNAMLAFIGLLLGLASNFLILISDDFTPNTISFLLNLIYLFFWFYMAYRQQYSPDITVYSIGMFSLWSTSLIHGLSILSLLLLRFDLGMDGLFIFSPMLPILACLVPLIGKWDFSLIISILVTGLIPFCLGIYTRYCYRKSKHRKTSQNGVQTK